MSLSSRLPQFSHHARRLGDAASRAAITVRPTPPAPPVVSPWVPCVHKLLRRGWDFRESGRRPGARMPSSIQLMPRSRSLRISTEHSVQFQDELPAHASMNPKYLPNHA
jgi:hypothetical protein